MTDLVTEARKVQKLCEEMNWEFCFIGGLALQIWGQPRLTKDIDLTLLTNFINDEFFVQTLLKQYKGRISDAEKFALQRRVLLLKTAGGIGIDISLGGLPFENEVINRSTYEQYTKEISLRTCSAEDLIVLKSVASRQRDWSDIETVIIKQQNLDWNYIEDQLTPFTEFLEVPEILTKLETLRDKFYQK